MRSTSSDPETSVSPVGRTCPESSITRTTPSAISLQRLLGKMCRSSRQGSGGRTLVLSLDPGEQLRGGVLTPNISVWPNDASVCSLSQVLVQDSIPPQYFLSSKACAGILRRAENRGKVLPTPLLRALQAVAGVSNEQATFAGKIQSLLSRLSEAGIARDR